MHSPMFTQHIWLVLTVNTIFPRTGDDPCSPVYPRSFVSSAEPFPTRPPGLSRSRASSCRTAAFLPGGGAAREAEKAHGWHRIRDAETYTKSGGIIAGDSTVMAKH